MTPGSAESSASKEPALIIGDGVQLAMPLVFVVDVASGFDPAVSGAIAGAVSGTSGAFTDSFLRSGAFDRAFGGDVRELSRQRGMVNVREILLGRSKVSYASQDELSPGLRTASLEVRLRRYRLKPQFRSDIYRIVSDGAGYSNEVALENACERLRARLRDLSPESASDPGPQAR